MKKVIKEFMPRHSPAIILPYPQKFSTALRKSNDRLESQNRNPIFLKPVFMLATLFFPFALMLKIYGKVLGIA